MNDNNFNLHQTISKNSKTQLSCWQTHTMPFFCENTPSTFFSGLQNFNIPIFFYQTLHSPKQQSTHNILQSNNQTMSCSRKFQATLHRFFAQTWSSTVSKEFQHPFDECKCAPINLEPNTQKRYSQ